MRPSTEVRGDAKGPVCLLVEGDVIRAFELDDVISLGLVFVVSPGLSVLEQVQTQLLTR